MVRILVIDTGGTISKVYGSGLGVWDVHIGPPYVADFIRRQAGEFVSITSLPIFRKDSLDIGHADRSAIVNACIKEPAEKIIIVHGTDTMLLTAEAISQFTVSKLKTIVLTGSLQPAAMKESDADFQIGLALATCVCQPSGVWIAMNGVHAFGSCRKHPVTGQFVPV